MSHYECGVWIGRGTGLFGLATVVIPTLLRGEWSALGMILFVYMLGWHHAILRYYFSPYSIRDGADEHVA